MAVQSGLLQLPTEILMTEQIKLTMALTNNSKFNDLAVELWLDNVIFFDQSISQGTHKVGHTFTEDEDQHQFKIVLKNKQDYHTTIDENGNILEDTIIDVKDICFDTVNIDSMMHDLAKYKHDTNGNSNILTEPFHGHLGCNGTVTLDFHLPFYMWLLENM